MTQNALFFYARVSSIDQSLERQLEAAREVGIAEEYIFVDKASGKDFQRLEIPINETHVAGG